MDLDDDGYCDEDYENYPDTEYADSQTQFGADETNVKVDLGNTARSLTLLLKVVVQNM